MAQGLVKKPTTTTTKPTTSKKGGISKRGSRQINPRNTKLIKQAKINKKFTAGLTAQTERMLGEKAGHLEMLGQGKKKQASSSNDIKHGKKNARKQKS